MLTVDDASLGFLLPKSRAMQVEALETLQKVVQKECVGKEWLGWFNWPQDSGFSFLKELFQYQETMSVYYDLILHVGIGGSYMGIKAIQQAFSPRYFSQYSDTFFKPIIYCGDNLSEDSLVEVLELLDQHRPLVTVASKSGNTLEIAATMRIIKRYMKNRFKESYKERIVVITDETEGSLRKQCQTEQFTSFTIPKDVGGRFSTLTAIGLVPLSLAGYRVKDLLDGADSFYHGIRRNDEKQVDPVVRLAAARKAAWDEGMLVDFFAYSEPKLFSFVEWWKQLFGESEGKNGKGLLPMGILYSTDLHSLGQYMQEGPRIVLETFFSITNISGTALSKRIQIPYKEDSEDTLLGGDGLYLQDLDKMAMAAARMAHAERGTPCLDLRLASFDLFHFGYMMAFFQTVCSVSALMLGANPFDQPGVEAYKQNLNDMLKEQSLKEEKV